MYSLPVLCAAYEEFQKESRTPACPKPRRPPSCRPGGIRLKWWRLASLRKPKARCIGNSRWPPRSYAGCLLVFSKQCDTGIWLVFPRSAHATRFPSGSGISPESEIMLPPQRRTLHTYFGACMAGLCPISQNPVWAALFGCDSCFCCLQSCSHRIPEHILCSLSPQNGACSGVPIVVLLRQCGAFRAHGVFLAA